jgi:dTDP-4-dehydrorhamnose reductase
MTRVLVLGSTGMLGHMVLRVLSREPSLDVEGTQRADSSDPLYLDAEQGREGLQALAARRAPYAYLINASGVTSAEIDAADAESIRRAICVNALFPHALASAAAATNARVLHISTDGVFSGHASSAYREDAAHDCTDPYGKTKSLGEVPRRGMLTLRCSIIGPDPRRRRGLLEWFLSQPAGASVTGYLDALWNGVTTLQLAELCRRIIVSGRFDALWEESPVHHVAPNAPVSKYELLQLFAAVFEKPVTVRPSPTGAPALRRVLATRYDGLKDLVPWNLRMEDAVRALADFRAAEPVA